MANALPISRTERGNRSQGYATCVVEAWSVNGLTGPNFTMDSDSYDLGSEHVIYLEHFKTYDTEDDKYSSDAYNDAAYDDDWTGPFQCGPNGAGSKGKEKSHGDYVEDADIYDFGGRYTERGRRKKQQTKDEADGAIQDEDTEVSAAGQDSPDEDQGATEGIVVNTMDPRGNRAKQVQRNCCCCKYQKGAHGEFAAKEFYSLCMHCRCERCETEQRHSSGEFRGLLEESGTCRSLQWIH
ncbi:hypothetical protein DL98DRAFT_619620 [Cadophora sp. DSE1049]|nr:hypothetical protein DL98DRAFT_619620 [Cadophora sp. DSE1049]